MAVKRWRMSLYKILKEDVGCVFERDPAARTAIEVLLTYPGVHALIMHRIANRIWHRQWHLSARFIAFFARAVTNIDIHPGATIGRRFFIDHGAGVVIGETAEIGRDVTLYHGVTLGGTSWNRGKRHPTLENGVMVGAGAKILGPISVKKKARVGANSVVIEDVPAGCTVVGIPGKVVQLKSAGHPNQFGIDLDHHLIPDPVGRAISCLLERIEDLEGKIGRMHSDTVGVPVQDECDLCDALTVCEHEQPVVQGGAG